MNRIFTLTEMSTRNGSALIVTPDAEIHFKPTDTVELTDDDEVVVVLPLDGEDFKTPIVFDEFSLKDDILDDEDDDEGDDEYGDAGDIVAWYIRNDSEVMLVIPIASALGKELFMRGLVAP